MTLQYIILGEHVDRELKMQGRAKKETVKQ
jgi:hypothetical protein